MNARKSFEMKPYRLINAHILEEIHQLLLPVFTAWNERYACKVLTFSLEQSFQKPEIAMLETIHPAIRTSSCWINIFTLCLFGEEDPCFHAASTEIAQELFDHLCLRPFQKNPWTEDWFYAGSSCIQMKVYCEDNHLDLYLHPDWIYAKLPQKEWVQSAPIPLQQALHPQLITVETRLKPFSISLQTLLNLEPGDLLQSDHPLSQPLQLVSNNNTLAEIQPGQLDNQKSILIESLL